MSGECQVNVNLSLTLVDVKLVSQTFPFKFLLQIMNNLLKIPWVVEQAGLHLRLRASIMLNQFRLLKCFCVHLEETIVSATIFHKPWQLGFDCVQPRAVTNQFINQP